MNSKAIKTSNACRDGKALSNQIKYIAPNLITATSLVLGVVSIFFSITGNAYWAGWMILISVLLDKLDGTTARLLGASSRFGVEFDSLADLIAFGAAPAIFAFTALHGNQSIILSSPHTILLTVGCGFYILCSAVRLARFNVEATLGGSDIYFGLPMPMAGGFLVTTLLFLMKYSPQYFTYHGWKLDYEILGAFSPPVFLFRYFWALIIITAFLMISGMKVPKPNPNGNKTRDIYLITNIAITYLFIPFRVFPEYLFLVALQYLSVAFVFTFFMKKTQKYQKRDFIDVLALPPLEGEPVKNED